MRKLETMVHLNANMLKEVTRNQEMVYTGQHRLVDMAARHQMRDKTRRCMQMQSKVWEWKLLSKCPRR